MALGAMLPVSTVWTTSSSASRRARSLLDPGQDVAVGLDLVGPGGQLEFDPLQDGRKVAVGQLQVGQVLEHDLRVGLARS